MKRFFILFSILAILLSLRVVSFAQAGPRILTMKASAPVVNCDTMKVVMRIATDSLGAINGGSTVIQTSVSFVVVPNTNFTFTTQSLDNGTYFWGGQTICIFNNNHTISVSTFSIPWHFTVVVNGVPSPPTPVSPTNGAVIIQ